MTKVAISLKSCNKAFKPPAHGPSGCPYCVQPNPLRVNKYQYCSHPDRVFNINILEPDTPVPFWCPIKVDE